MKIRAFPTLTLAVFALTAAPALAGHDHHRDRHCGSPLVVHGHLDEGFAVAWDGDTLLLRPEAGARGQVAITPEGTLRINGDAVTLDRGQRRLLQDFYGQYVAIEEDAAALGAEGAKLGVASAALAARALTRVVRLTRDDYDEQDLEREMEAEGAHLEREGAALEKRGEALEVLADELGARADGLRARIPELAALDWFRMDGHETDDDAAD